MVDQTHTHALPCTQAIRLCQALSGVRLSFHSDAAMRDSVAFLRRAHPLSYTSSIKKSQLHHALGEMVTAVLWPLVRAGLPHSCTHISPEVRGSWRICLFPGCGAQLDVSHCIWEVAVVWLAASN